MRIVGDPVSISIEVDCPSTLPCTMIAIPIATLLTIDPSWLIVEVFIDGRGSPLLPARGSLKVAVFGNRMVAEGFRAVVS